jgi:hypothetical protein
VHHRPDGGESPEHHGESWFASELSGRLGLEPERQQADGARQSEDRTKHRDHSYLFVVRFGTGRLSSTRGSELHKELRESRKSAGRAATKAETR